MLCCMNTDDYRYIITIAEEKSFTNASKKLFVAQSSLSQRVKRIEEKIGITIFIRGMNGVYLTREGKCFVKYARKILSNAIDMKNEIMDMRGLRSGLVRIGSSQLMNTDFYDSMIACFNEKYPGIQFEFVEECSDMLECYLLSGKIDIAILHLPITSSELKYEVLFNDRLVLVPRSGSQLGNRSFYREESGTEKYISVQSLEREPFALPNPGTRLYSLCEKIFAAADISPNILHWSKNYNALHSIGKMGLASTILMESFFDSVWKNETYYYLDCEIDASFPCAVVWPNDKYLDYAAKEMIKIYREIRSK